MEEILELLENNAKLTEEQMAVMLGKSVEEVKEIIKKYEDDNTIAGYTTMKK